ncbi:MAG: hypothetical protein L0241_26830 [Planctomycetia bacterium]|nr:hypothetical protein [Planctomycetia bacterium]
MKRLMILGVVALAGLVGCMNQKPTAEEPNKQEAPPSDANKLDAFVMAEKPANAISVRDALTRKDGEKVVVSGRTPPENVKPFNAAVAAFVLMAPEDLDREDIKSEFDCDTAAT